LGWRNCCLPGALLFVDLGYRQEIITIALSCFLIRQTSAQLGTAAMAPGVGRFVFIGLISGAVFERQGWRRNLHNVSPPRPLFQRTHIPGRSPESASAAPECTRGAARRAVCPSVMLPSGPRRRRRSAIPRVVVRHRAKLARGPGRPGRSDRRQGPRFPDRGRGWCANSFWSFRLISQKPPEKAEANSQ